MTRPSITGPDRVIKPYPLKLETTVIAGYGRGSAELGIPTANIPQSDFDSLNVEETGVYYGYACLYHGNESDCDIVKGEGGRTVVANFGRDLNELRKPLPMVMSVGWNPFFGNSKKSAEIHIIHKFSSDFYGAKLRLIILGYIRPELDYVSKEALIDDINTDVKVAMNCLEREDYKRYSNDEFFNTHP